STAPCAAPARASPASAAVTRGTPAAMTRRESERRSGKGKEGPALRGDGAHATPSPPRSQCQTPSALFRVAGEREGVRGPELLDAGLSSLPSPSPLPSPPLAPSAAQPCCIRSVGERA